jgi:hypothetical protein
VIDDLTVAHESAIVAGATVVHEPRSEPWGTSARYRELEGNVIDLAQGR